jgi:hypothetical protein
MEQEQERVLLYKRLSFSDLADTVLQTGRIVLPRNQVSREKAACMHAQALLFCHNLDSALSLASLSINLEHYSLYLPSI